MEQFTISEMQEMQMLLQEKYKDKWEPICAEVGQNKLLWMIGEIGEVIDIVKKHGGEQASSNPDLRRSLIEEMADVSLDMPKAAIRNVAKTPIVCDFSHSRLNIQADVRIKYGKNVNKTIKALQDHIAKAISDMTDVNASTINIKVVGVEF